MKLSIGFALPVLFWTVMMAGPARSQEFAVNGEFEAVQIGSPFFSNNPANVPNWTHTGAAGDALIWSVGYSDGGGSITTAGSGNQFVTMGGGSTSGSGQWSQTLVGLSPGSIYNLNFKMASETSNLAQNMTVDFTSGSSTGAQNFFAATSPANYWRSWESKSMQFVATSNSVRLRFSATTGQDVGLDSVSVRAATATPEPGSIALLAGLGISGGVFTRRRRSRKP